MSSVFFETLEENGEPPSENADENPGKGSETTPPPEAHEWLATNWALGEGALGRLGGFFVGLVLGTAAVIPLSLFLFAIPLGSGFAIFVTFLSMCALGIGLPILCDWAGHKIFDAVPEEKRFLSEDIAKQIEGAELPDSGGNDDAKKLRGILKIENADDLRKQIHRLLAEPIFQGDQRNGFAYSHLIRWQLERPEILVKLFTGLATTGYVYLENVEGKPVRCAPNFNVPETATAVDFLAAFVADCSHRLRGKSQLSSDLAAFAETEASGQSFPDGDGGELDGAKNRARLLMGTMSQAAFYEWDHNVDGFRPAVKILEVFRRFHTLMGKKPEAEAAAAENEADIQKKALESTKAFVKRQKEVYDSRCDLWENAEKFSISNGDLGPIFPEDEGRKPAVLHRPKPEEFLETLIAIRDERNLQPGTLLPVHFENHGCNLIVPAANSLDDLPRMGFIPLGLSNYKENGTRRFGIWKFGGFTYFGWEVGLPFSLGTFPVLSMDNITIGDPGQVLRFADPPAEE
ncbi:MAG: hypothetical protein LBS68_02120 [Puniceicoccales bacterium]|jgi:hypothetical protein|nr:hypothetical protein [Puniceicoccales bacterium]